ncbi:hypothetical protein RF11_13279 [Thelohanellus kitauei]|uniref:Uncharacterized protein n=1 Tax=Thelohanellus kitauei TaxID=669202 RepID=A0A0C2N1Y9_THEKT|nr:hypothetical protein RF11_13279 [Thelohanellus kitauei]
MNWIKEVRIQLRVDTIKEISTKNKMGISGCETELIQMPETRQNILSPRSFPYASISKVYAELERKGKDIIITEKDEEELFNNLELALLKLHEYTITTQKSKCKF